jgi:GT2 family glycosyltransferase
MSIKSLAVVILNYNGKNYLEKFLPGVISHSNEADIIVADNASTDDSVEYLKRHFPEVKLIQNNSNGGFAKGYNEALKGLNYSYFLLLNSDIEVTPNWLNPLMLKMEKNPTIAGVQPKILSYTNRTHFEHAGASGGFLDRNYYPFCRGRIFELTELDSCQYDGETEIFWATGACLLIRSDIFFSSGGFDPYFFAHMEEIDLCWRIKKQGFEFHVVPSSVVYHVGGGTLPYSSPQKTYLNFRNSLFMLIKNHDGLLIPKLFNRLLLDGIAAIRFLIRLELKQFFALFKAHMHVYTHLPYLLKARKTLNALTNQPNMTGWYKGNILWARYVKGIQSYSGLNQRLFLRK